MSVKGRAARSDQHDSPPRQHGRVASNDVAGSIDADADDRADGDRIVGKIIGARQSIDFVREQNRRFGIDAEIAQDRLDARALTRPVGIRDVDDVQEEIGVRELLERRGGDELFKEAR